MLRVRDVPQENCHEAHRLLDEHIAHVGTRITELQDLERQLKALRRECDSARAEQDSGILNGLGLRAEAGRRKTPWHTSVALTEADPARNEFKST